MGAPLLEIRDLTVAFDTPRGRATAVEDVSLSLEAGSVLGLVGESGCGKTLTALSILGLVPAPGRVRSGRIVFDGRDLRGLSEAELRAVRGRRIGMIFQEPLTALNPVFTVGEQIAEGLRHHLGASRRAAWSRAVALLEEVGVPDPARRARAYPHQLSGGLRQRAMIAMALAPGPDLLLADEPTTALDPTLQAQILALLARLRAERGLAILLVTHDLGVVAEACEAVAVMYAGRVVERAPVEALFEAPAHPYTAGLLSSIPRRLPDGRRAPLRPIPGAVPSPFDRPPGCAFAPRCPRAAPACAAAEPALEALAPDRRVACLDPQAPRLRRAT